MFSLSRLSLLGLVPFVVASPPLKRQVDGEEHCGQWDEIVAGQYTLYLDQWGLENADSGESCATLTSLDGTTIGWENRWNWEGGEGVKSYTNVNLNEGIGSQLSAINSIPATWEWSQTTTGSIVANIAFDVFTSSTQGGSNENEIMVWVANYGAGPISYEYGADGQPVPVASSVDVAGHTWNLYHGTNGAQEVYSFLTADGAAIQSFSGDLNEFIKYLTANQGLSTNQYLTTVQSGTEATSGSAVFTSTAYSASVN
ncbi:glycoside hydrolase family 12 protein [Moniliophthora roreri MCA 2997]|uniref:Glycoside hydrolase family 12 protein n=1 Tax=Moniliophthora roreri (strain MCA 2997) TaxID=1381753 RepID=V2WLK8_MONRO|nr:glycoside hydrolase family 12 protein [Moniliophthora roreri MCA 2997]